MKLDDPDMKETLIMFIDKGGFQKKKSREFSLTGGHPNSLPILFMIL